jgi:hypothetical protein
MSCGTLVYAMKIYRFTRVAQFLGSAFANFAGARGVSDGVAATTFATSSFARTRQSRNACSVVRQRSNIYSSDMVLSMQDACADKVSPHASIADLRTPRAQSCTAAPGIKHADGFSSSALHARKARFSAPHSAPISLAAAYKTDDLAAIWYLDYFVSSLFAMAHLLLVRNRPRPASATGVIAMMTGERAGEDTLRCFASRKMRFDVALRQGILVVRGVTVRHGNVVVRILCQPKRL